MQTNKTLNTFGNNVKKYRKKQGMSQENLARKAGMHRTYIGGIEAKGRNVSLINIAKIAKALQVSIEQLIR